MVTLGMAFLLFCAGAVMCIVGPGMKYSVPMVYYARYVILQMGLFAVFAGFMYNDLFGMVSLELFDTRYEKDAGTDKLHHPVNGTDGWSFDSLNIGNGYGPYPFGIDWMWHGKANELLFVNSVKMKLSVLMGVLQMTLGVFLKWANAFHDRSKIDFFCECIPMLMFMMCFFGYMDYMILYKWTHVIPGSSADPNIDWKGYDSSTFKAEGPPGIINSLICMAMHTKDPQPLFEGAGSTASYCMLGVLLSVPWILGPKPFLLKGMHQKAQKTKAKKVSKQVSVIVLEQLQDASFALDESVMHFVEAAVAKFPEITRNKNDILGRPNQETYEPSRASLAESREHWKVCREELYEAIAALLTMDAKGADAKLSRTVTSKLRDELVAIGEFHHLDMGDVGGGHGHGGKFEFGEVMIHQIIETIEYVLGTVSHTASYLRIWALSLAHQQLSDVFYKKTLGMAFAMNTSGPVVQGMIIWFMFGAWFLVTVLVLLMMDVLECFLHTLRLHWVEFQSKFYRNNGRSFRPHDLMVAIMDSDQ
jgi:V-type H+-transporting ATPase subunit a